MKMDIRIFEVGGSIRNEILGIPPSDRDFSVLAPGYETMKSYLLSRGATIFQERPQFVAIRAKLPELGAVDFTLARKESFYTDGRHPDSISPAESIEQDLCRRDFRMNAIARELGMSELIDPFNGQYDISHKLIQPVGCALDRFNEDKLRIIRAIRFSCQLGFEISNEILDAINQFTIDDFVNVSKERLQIELVKAFSSNTRRALEYFWMFPYFTTLLLEKKLWLEPTLKKC